MRDCCYFCIFTIVFKPTNKQQMYTEYMTVNIVGRVHFSNQYILMCKYIIIDFCTNVLRGYWGIYVRVSTRGTPNEILLIFKICHCQNGC